VEAMNYIAPYNLGHVIPMIGNRPELPEEWTPPKNFTFTSVTVWIKLKINISSGFFIG